MGSPKMPKIEMPDTGGQMMLMRQMQKEQMEMQEKMYQKRQEELRIEEENRMKRDYNQEFLLTKPSTQFKGF